jgi:hypothetical protein
MAAYYNGYIGFSYLPIIMAIEGPTNLPIIMARDGTNYLPIIMAMEGPP